MAQGTKRNNYPLSLDLYEDDDDISCTTGLETLPASNIRRVTVSGESNSNNNNDDGNNSSAGSGDVRFVESEKMLAKLVWHVSKGSEDGMAAKNRRSFATILFDALDDGGLEKLINQGKLENKINKLAAYLSDDNEGRVTQGMTQTIQELVGLLNPTGDDNDKNGAVGKDVGKDAQKDGDFASCFISLLRSLTSLPLVHVGDNEELSDMTPNSSANTPGRPVPPGRNSPAPLGSPTSTRLLNGNLSQASSAGASAGHSIATFGTPPPNVPNVVATHQNPPDVAELEMADFLDGISANRKWLRVLVAPTVGRAPAADGNGVHGSNPGFHDTTTQSADALLPATLFAAMSVGDEAPPPASGQGGDLDDISDQKPAAK